MSGKSTKLVVRQRVEEIFRLRIAGAEFHEIREYADATKDQEGQPRQPWGVSDTQLRRYIRKADDLCKERFNGQADHLLARHLLQRRQLYALLLEVGDYKGALNVLRDEAELEGLYAPKKVEVTGKGGGPLRVTVEDLVQADRELEEWERERGSDTGPGPAAPPPGSPQVP